MSEKPISPLRQRMLEDMNMRRFVPDTQREYIRAVKKLASFLGRSPDSATAEELRAFQLHLTEAGLQPQSINATVTALRFFFKVTLDRPESPSLAPTVVAACSSSRPSRPAASHDTLQPRLSPQSGSTPHERGRRITHPHRQARLSLVKTPPRRRSTEQRPVSAFHGAFGHGTHPLRCSSRPETHQRPLSRGCHALAPRVHRDQIAIARRPPTQPPARSFTGGFRTTAAVQAEASRWAVIRNPSQKRKFPGSRGTSVLPSGPDIVSLPRHVRLVPTTEVRQMSFS